MSRISKAVSKMNEDNILRKDEIVTNFMGGDSYKINPLDTLKMIAASSIFGEASYYRSNVNDGRFNFSEEFSDDFAKSIFKKYSEMTTTQIFEKAIDDALSYDFNRTLMLAWELRETYNMRLNPQIIMVRAALHPLRKEFSDKHRGAFGHINSCHVMSRADEPMSQLAYYLYLNKGKKNKIPSILKRSIANKLSHLSTYDINKYKNHEIGMINAVRLTHANSEALNELMRTGTVEVSESSQTWEQKRSAGMSWKDIVNTTYVGHMALLRNLRNIFTEVDDVDFCYKCMQSLIMRVAPGKQFPFRYWSAYNAVQDSCEIHHKQMILDTLEQCIDLSILNMPRLKGKTMCLSDNSGSAWGTIPSEYGSVKVAIIDNLSATIASACSDEGYVGKFGDTIIEFPISKDGILQQCNNISKNTDGDVGGSTEGGIWEFFRDAINNKICYDNIFIFSDMQAGTGDLYGTEYHRTEYSQNYSVDDENINVFKLIQDYRRLVNPKVNVFSVQTAGYNNVLIPEMSYRCAMLTGWTGKEIQFASEYIKQWDEIENRNMKG